MFEFIKKQLDIKLIKSLFKFSLIYCVLFNSAIFIYKFEYHNANILSAIAELSKDFIYNIITLFIFFLALSFHRLLFIAGSLFLFITGAIASYYLFFFSIAPTPGMMPIIFGTHSAEIYELVSIKIITWILFSVLICMYCIKIFHIRDSKLPFTRFLSFICIIIVATNIITPKFSFFRSYFPMQYLHNSYMFFMSSNNDYIKEDISTKYKFIDNSEDDIVAVLVIGESARYSNFGINGYSRDTTPYLSKYNDIASFKARSCSNNTFLSVPCMISRYGENDLDKVDRETSILSILTGLGFNTMWLATQSITKYYKNRPGGSFYEEANFHMIPGGSLVFLPNSDDMQMVPYLEQNINQKGKHFVVLHSTGSHWRYSLRYPREFAKFQPDSNSALKEDAPSCDKEELLNSYDNSILYTDFFLHSVIEKLKDKKAFLIYSSDHGESLGEEGRYAHGSHIDAEEQRTVPFIIWMSDSYKKAYPDKWRATMQATTNEISHDYIFHSILDCIGIDSEIVDKSLSLCRGGK